MDTIAEVANVLQPAHDSPVELSKLITINSSLNSTNAKWHRYKETGYLYDGRLAFAHFTTQLPALTGFCIIAVICIAITVSSVTITVARFGCRRCGAKRYQPHPTSKYRFAMLFFLFAFCWIVMVASLLIFAYGSIDLCTYRTSIVSNITHLGSDGLDILYANPHDKNVYAFTFAMLIIICIPTFFSLILSLLVVVTGSICYLRSYHPMDRSSTSNRMGVWTVRLAVFLLIAAPLLLLLADLSFAYAELHSQLCPTLQKNIQLKALEQKLDSFEGMIDDAEVIEVLNDLNSHQRATFNERECHHHGRSVHAIWISEMLLGTSGFICSIVLLCLSKFFLRMKTEYYWNSSDNYSTLSDVRPDCTKIATVSSAF